MAIIKYGPGITPMRNEHSGYTFEKQRQGNLMIKSQANDRKRYPNQTNRQVNLMKCTREWRNMSAATKNAWSAFASAFPQECKKDATKFLSGYQLFLKRNQYLFLNYGIEEPFLEAPLMSALAAETVTFSIDQSENCIDCTQAYIKAFGILPIAGDFLLLKVLPMSVRSGHFFAPVQMTVEVLTVYIDGMFLSLHFPSKEVDIVYSIYLSAPVNQSIAYQGTKSRYMGCFTAKRFIDLSDTPATYTGQALKMPRVNAAENALEFVTAPSGGITCADLPACPTILAMNANIVSISNLIINNNLSSYPAIKYGRLYNFPAILDSRNICPPGFHVPTRAEIDALFLNLGGLASAYGLLKETLFTFWDSPNTGATNAYKFNARGSGYLVNTGSFFFQLRQYGDFWSSSYKSGSTLLAQAFGGQWNSAAALIDDSQSIKNGFSIRCLKDNSSPVSSVIGNSGITYRCCQIGNQIWIADNLAEDRFRNGDVIPTVTTGSAWFAATTALQCAYSFSPANIFL